MLFFNPSFANNVELFQISNKISEIVSNISRVIVVISSFSASANELTEEANSQ